MTKRSAGILMYRRSPELEVLLAHPGGPFWAKKDEGSWSIPKGEYDEAEEPLACAITFDPPALRSNRFELEWPPKSGRMQSLPEIDRVEWFAPDWAKVKILLGQQCFIDRLLAALHKPR